MSCALIDDGSLNMMHVKNLVHSLPVKWFQRICTDCGSSWSKFIWPILTVIIPYQLLQGLHSVTDALLSKLPPFYAQVVCSYAHTNNLYYKAFDSNTLPQNLWCGVAFSHIDNDWISAGFYTVVDLPIQVGKIDVIAVTQRLHEVGCHRSPYLYCCAFQSCFVQFFA